ncbi:DUF4157 domain-containing protein [Mucilaginibacter jinjuensis]|uniref:DUF4157 domain-containing protein n=1 Tax=Mucilaginibacter jinjuensis TaxID=1176721 RepID=A0ABY7T5L2_9SPHI|nr:DUF4157 domain-containing protein [Mucilaginibacter jinjuensis]WCT11642.1 DUF4157 domain-containing protein [Mucilaginibacter jinjuensis]
MKSHDNKIKESKTYSPVQTQQKPVSGLALKDNRQGATAQAKFSHHTSVQMTGKSSLMDNRPVQMKGNNTGLPDQLKAGVENISGHSLDDVKVHYNSAEPAKMQAHAYAQGNQIHIAPGQEKHLPHEAWHVVQQKQGRVRPTIQMKGGLHVNDDYGLEHEADTMGVLALKADSQNSSQSVKNTDTPNNVIQQSHIKTAGLELELKGAALVKEDETGKKIGWGAHEKIIDKNKWWIEIDSNNAELVTKPTNSSALLFEWLTEGLKTLNDIQLYAAQSDFVNKLSDVIPPNEEEDAEVKKFIATGQKLGLGINVLVATNKGLEHHAKPQITFGIHKGELFGFTSKIRGGKIKYSKGKNKDNTKTHIHEEWPRVHLNVDWIKEDSPLFATEKGKEFGAALNSSTPAASGLCLMTIIAILFATRQQDEKNDWEYYKARFSVMPRVPLSVLYDEMELADQGKYDALVVLWHNAVKDYNAKGPENAHPTRMQNATKDNTASYTAELASVIDPTKRHKKTLEGGDKQVDAISSDAMASTSNVGASVGALDLPAGTDGVFEIRTMPYISINVPAEVLTIYREVINAYGGMEE